MVDSTCGAMAGVSPLAASSLAQQTPSPFSFSVASTRWSFRPPIHLANIFLRFFALVFSFVSALSLADLSPNKKSQPSISFTDYPEFMYCFIVSILTFIYSSFQLFKGICDTAHRGILISDMISDYSSFILDQLVGYLLISSSSMAIPVIQHMKQTGTLWRAAIISTTISFVTFLVISTCTLLSGYKLFKRIIW
ncbi:hypothetical protein ACOSP7_025730 [Xanthoceras sorbifolium]|uniref:CASP-like protein n=1 Tax=Xanthoceras sorbifolium TaxID=99658 RepID=A0ABQ8H6C7_9ROSI|nr:hypothetical protein JRO89_XS13G0036100 [Xanthoceras sorbifolium]